MLYMDNGPIARSAMFLRVLSHNAPAKRGA